MRTFELILLVLVAVLPFVKRPILRRINVNHLLITLLILFVSHLIIEGLRWQMIPAYLLFLLLAWRLKVVNPEAPARLSFIRVLGFLVVIFIIFIAWIMPAVLPVFSLPEPRGAFNVGTQEMYVKTDRDEIITEDPTDKRELLYKIWYPSRADISGLASDKYVDQASREGFAMKYGLPPSALNYLDHVETNVYPNIPVADGSFPVLIFSHGYGSKATGYYSLLTEIASQGYVVINMNHTYESLGVTLPDGRKKYFDFGFQQKISEGGMAVMDPLREAFREGLPFEERHPIVQKAVKAFYESKSMDRWVEDMTGTIDLLEKWNRNGPLAGTLDLDKIGVFGHSNGGGSAGKVPLVDDRVKAAANLDGVTYGNLIDTTYHIPFLYVSADWPAEHEDMNSHIYINKSTDYFYETKLLQSGHPNFMDIPFMVPVNAVAGTGAIDPYLGTEIVTRLVTSFFDKHLKNLPDADPAKLGETYELLEMKVHKGDSIQ